MVPDGWKISTLGEVCENNLQTGPFGSQLHANEYEVYGVPVLMPKDLNGFRANTSSAAKISVERARDLSKHRLSKGDILFSRRGDVTRFALIDESSEGSLCGTGCLKATPGEQHSPDFLGYFLQMHWVRKWLEQNAVGQTMPNMNTSILSELPLMVASSRQEEDTIAQILSTWDQAITATERLLENSQQRKKGLMQQLLTGKKRLPGFEGEWEVVKLASVAHMSSGGTPKSSVTSYYGGEIPWVSIADMTSQGKWINNTEKNLSKLGIENSSARIYPANTILYAMYASIGECSIARVPVSSSQAILGIQPSSDLHFEFLYFYLSSLKEEIKLQGQQGTQSNLNAGMVKAFKMPLPDLSEQLRISAVLNAADREIDALQKSICALRREKKALMQQLLTGKRRVQVAAA